MISSCYQHLQFRLKDMPQRIQEEADYIRNKLGEGNWRMINFPNHSF